MRDFGGKRWTTWSRDQQAAVAGPPGKRTLTETLPPASVPVERKAATSTPPSVMPRPIIDELFGGVQREAAGTELNPAAVHASADRIATSEAPLPHSETIQGAFGRHDISGIGGKLVSPSTPLGPGKGLPGTVRGKMERSFGADFSDVRVHEGTHVREVGATAYAEGNQLHFAPGAYDTSSRSGQELIGHELTHVVQQRGGRTTVAQSKGAADASLEAEADTLGARAAAGEPVTVIGRAATGLQRKLDPAELATLRAKVVEIASQRNIAKPVVDQVVNMLDQEFNNLKPAMTAIDLAFAYLLRTPGPSTSTPGPSTSTPGPSTSTASNRGPAFSFTLEPIMFNGQAVRGTDDPEGGLEELDVELSEWHPAEHEVQQLYQLLCERSAPGDDARMTHIAEYASQRATYRDDDNDSEFEEPDFDQDSDEDECTDTDGSDSDDERRHQAQMATKTARSQQRERTRRVSDRLKHSLYEERLKKVADPKLRDGVLFKGKWRPNGKKLYRKEAKFNHPSEDVGERAQLPVQPTEAQRQDLAQLNLMLSLGVPMEVALRSLLNATQFLVAQYRGMWYAPSKFPRRLRRRHRNLDEHRRPIYSQAARAEGSLGISGYYALYNDPTRRSDLERYQAELDSLGLDIRTTLQALANTKPDLEIKNAVGRNTDRFQPQHLGDVSTHFYSENYDSYFNGLVGARERAQSGGAAQPLDPLYSGLPNSGNPKVSTGDVPVHSSKYSYGMKPYVGHEEDVLEPEYDGLGTPKHPYSGKTYTSLHPLTDYDPKRGPTQLVPLQNAHRINISQMIIPERESQFDGMLEADRVVAQYKSKFPNFAKGYKDVYAIKYGLTRELFDRFAEAMVSTDEGSAERLYVESLLSSYLSKHSELRAIEDAQRIAAQRGAQLVYRTGPTSFGFVPPLIETNRARSDDKEPATKRTRTKGSDALPTVRDLKAVLDALAKHQVTVQPTAADSDASPSNAVPPPSNLLQLVASQYGDVIQISGDGLSCYIRSLVSAACVIYGCVQLGQIENIVSAISDHLAAVQLRTRAEMINAGGLVAAEVRRVLAELVQQLDLQVNVVQWDATTGQIIHFHVNDGTAPVWLLYTEGHFALICRT